MNIGGLAGCIQLASEAGALELIFIGIVDSGDVECVEWTDSHSAQK